MDDTNMGIRFRLMMLLLSGLFFLCGCSQKRFSFRSKIRTTTFNERKEVAKGFQEKTSSSASETSFIHRVKTKISQKPTHIQKAVSSVDTLLNIPNLIKPMLTGNSCELSHYQTKSKQPYNVKEERPDHSGILGILSLISGVLSLLIVLVFVFKTGAFFFGLIPLILSISLAVLAIILGRIAIKDKEWDYPLGIVGSTLGIIWLSILVILSLLIWMFVSIVLCLTI